MKSLENLLIHAEEEQERDIMNLKISRSKHIRERSNNSWLYLSPGLNHFHSSYHPGTPSNNA